MGIGNVGWTEILVIGIIVLVFFGPRRLPEIANAVGRSLREFRKALNEVRTEISQSAGMAEPPLRPPSSGGPRAGAPYAGTSAPEPAPTLAGPVETAARPDAGAASEPGATARPDAGAASEPGGTARPDAGAAPEPGGTARPDAAETGQSRQGENGDAGDPKPQQG